MLMQALGIILCGCCQHNDIKTIEGSADVLFNACENIGLVVNIGKTEYVEIGHHQGIMANEHIAIGNNSYQREETFRYLGSSLTEQNCIRGNKCAFTVGNSCYSQSKHFQSLLSFSMRI